MEKGKRVVIVGAGRIGQALGALIKDRHTVSYWDTKDGLVSEYTPLAESVPRADVILLCTPSLAVASSCRDISSLVSGHAVVVSLAKGIEEATGRTMDEVLRHGLPAGQKIAVLGGPMLAAELSGGLGGAGVVGADEHETYERLAELFAGSLLHIAYGGMARDVALASVLKNIYAVALGIADGLGWGSNRKGWLVAESLGEMIRAATVLGIKEEVVAGVAGLGDMVATGFSPSSRNRCTGERIVETGHCSTSSEGCRSLPWLVRKLAIDDYRILGALDEIVVKGRGALEVFSNILV